MCEEEFIPDINLHQYLVFSVEAKTGIVLKTNGKRYQRTEGRWLVFWLFETYDEAKEFILEQLVKNPEIEYSIVNSEKKCIYLKSKYREE